MKGHDKEGRRPFVYYEGVKYSNEVLLRSPQLINKSLELLINTDDLRVIKAFLADGSELGNLTAIGKWGVSPHNLRTRKAINKLKNNKMIHFNQYEDPISVYQKYLERESLKNKTSRNKLASLNKDQKSRDKRYPTKTIENDTKNIDNLQQSKLEQHKKQNNDEQQVDKRILKKTIIL